jgi:hypothetical protein
LLLNTTFHSVFFLMRGRHKPFLGILFRETWQSGL